MCVQTVGLLAHAVEGAGIPTVVVSLLQSVTRVIRPPRALEVPFPFGYPLGRPADAAMQTAVLEAALALLPRADLPAVARFDSGPPP